MVIMPKVFVTPDRPIVRFKEPKEKIDLEKEIQRVLKAQGWGLGTYFNVQFVSHDETELLYQAEYVVTKDCESFQTSEDNQYNPSSKTVHIREFKPVMGSVADQSGQAIRAVVSGLGQLEDRVKVLEEKPKRGRKPKEIVEEG